MDVGKQGERRRPFGEAGQVVHGHELAVHQLQQFSIAHGHPQDAMFVSSHGVNRHAQWQGIHAEALQSPTRQPQQPEPIGNDPQRRVGIGKQLFHAAVSQLGRDILPPSLKPLAVKPDQTVRCSQP